MVGQTQVQSDASMSGLLSQHVACRHGGSHKTEPIDFHKTVSVLMLGSTIVTVLLAPMVAVFFLDENCEFTLVTG